MVVYWSKEQGQDLSRAQPVWIRLRAIHNWSEVLHRSIPTVWRRHRGPMFVALVSYCGPHPLV